MNFDADLNACAALVEKADPDRFAAIMASPLAARPVLFPIYAFNLEIAHAPWVTQEPMIAEMRLQWWRDALEEIAAGRAVRRHEVVTPLAKVLLPESAQLLDRSVAARRWDVYRDPFDDAAHFAAYIDDTAGGIMWAAACALGAEEMARENVMALARACGLAKFLQAVPELEARGRVPLVDGRPAAIAVLAREALRGMPARSVLKRVLPRRAWPALTEAFLAKPVLDQVIRRPASVAEGRLQILPLARTYHLWRWS
jgi:phytoene synthase